MISKDTLDVNTKKVLQDLLNKNPKDLLPDEIAILMARRDYLTESELKNIPKVEEVVEIKETPKVIKWKPSKE